LTGASVEDGMNVWIAVGVLLVLGHWSNEDALALMRAYAFSHDTTLDDVASQIVEQRRPGDLLP